ncbi:hypothetical protein ACF0H5_000523 [Mactra antiquata]
MLTNQTAFQSSLGETLEDINNAHTKAYLPVIIFGICVIVVGFPSNALAFIFFSKKATKSSFHCFISAISLNDALVNLAIIQDSIALFQYINNDNIACKLYFFLIHLLVGNSLLLIVAISVDRFRRVVYPFARQITVKMAKIIVVGTSMLSLSLSVHYFYTSSIEHITFPGGSNQTVVGYFCTLSEEYPQATVSKIFHVLYICFHILSIGFLIISYIIIMKKLISLRNKVKSKINSSAHKKSPQDCPSSMTTMEDQTDETVMDYSSNETKNQETGKSSFSLEKQSESKPSGSNIVVSRLRGASALSETERAFSVTAFVITVASIICFVPYYVNASISEPNLDGKSLVHSVIHMVTRRSYMLNSIVNPFIMFYFNTAFRKFVVSTLCCLCKNKKAIVAFMK